MRQSQLNSRRSESIWTWRLYKPWTLHRQSCIITKLYSIISFFLQLKRHLCFLLPILETKPLYTIMYRLELGQKGGLREPISNFVCIICSPFLPAIPSSVSESNPWGWFEFWHRLIRQLEQLSWPGDRTIKPCSSTHFYLFQRLLSRLSNIDVLKTIYSIGITCHAYGRLYHRLSTDSWMDGTWSLYMKSLDRIVFLLGGWHWNLALIV